MLKLFGINKKNIYKQQLKADIACSLQVTFEKALFSTLRYMEKNFSSNNLSYSGGCAMNSLANGKILQKTKYTFGAKHEELLEVLDNISPKKYKRKSFGFDDDFVPDDARLFGHVMDGFEIDACRSATRR